MGHERANLGRRQCLAEGRHPRTPVHDRSPAGDRVVEGVVRAPRHRDRVGVGRRRNRERRRVRPVAPSRRTVARGAPVRIQRCAISGTWRRRRRRGEAANRVARTRLQVPDDERSRRRRHRRARHGRGGDDARRVRHHRGDVGLRSPAAYRRQVGGNPSSVPRQCMTTEARQLVAQQRLRLANRRRRERVAAVGHGDRANGDVRSRRSRPGRRPLRHERRDSGSEPPPRRRPDASGHRRRWSIGIPAPTYCAATFCGYRSNQLRR